MVEKGDATGSGFSLLQRESGACCCFFKGERGGCVGKVFNRKKLQGKRKWISDAVAAFLLVTVKVLNSYNEKAKENGDSS